MSEPTVQTNTAEKIPPEKKESLVSSVFDSICDDVPEMSALELAKMIGITPVMLSLMGRLVP